MWGDNMKYGIKNKTCGVYLIRNKFNKKFYIGASVNIASRLSQHFKLSKNLCNDRLHEDVLKYGIEGFEWEVLCECSKDRLLEMERCFYDTMKPTYNYVRPCEKHVENEFIRQRAKEKCRSEEYRKKKREQYSTSEYRKLFHDVQKHRMKPVFTIKDGKRIEFESISDASRWVNKTFPQFEGKNKISKIKSVCDGERPSAYGLKWQYIKCNDYPERE